MLTIYTFNSTFFRSKLDQSLFQKGNLAVKTPKISMFSSVNIFNCVLDDIFKLVLTFGLEVHPDLGM